MKKAIIKSTAVIAFILIAAYALSMTCFADQTMIAGIEAEDVSVGDVFDVKITIGKNNGILSGSFNVIFDNTLLELVSATSDTEMMNGVMYALNDKYSERSVRISFASGNVFGESGGELMMLKFSAKKAGNAEFRVEMLKLIDGNQARYPWADSSKFVTVTSKIVTATGETPAPTSIRASESSDSKAESGSDPQKTSGAQSISATGTETVPPSTVVLGSEGTAETGTGTRAPFNTEKAVTSAASSESISSSAAGTTGSVASTAAASVKTKDSSSGAVLVIVIAAAIVITSVVVLTIRKKKNRG